MTNGITPEQIHALREEHIGRLLLRAQRAFSEAAYTRLRARGHEGLSIVHTNMLAHLDIEGTTLTVLAERAGITKQAMRELVDDLEAKGYVTSATDLVDRRARRIKFTDAGWQFLRDAYAVKLEIEQDYRQVLGEEGLLQLRNALEKLVNR
jgi:DNA-binding MarR family transcriptional regulator